VGLGIRRFWTGEKWRAIQKNDSAQKRNCCRGTGDKITKLPLRSKTSIPLPAVVSQTDRWIPSPAVLSARLASAARSPALHNAVVPLDLQRRAPQSPSAASVRLPVPSSATPARPPVRASPAPARPPVRASPAPARPPARRPQRQRGHQFGRPQHRCGRYSSHLQHKSVSNSRSTSNLGRGVFLPLQRYCFLAASPGMFALSVRGMH
jgi:hypothetical protein